MHALVSTYPGKPLQRDYSLIRLLIKSEVAYTIKVTKKNKSTLEATFHIDSSKKLQDLAVNLKQSSSFHAGPVGSPHRPLTGESYFFPENSPGNATRPKTPWVARSRD